MAPSKKPKCTAGTPCGFTCISSKKVCSAKVQQRTAQALLAATGVQSAPPKIAAYSAVRTLGEGDFGKAELTDRGTVVKTAKPESGLTEGDMLSEYNALKLFSKLGIGPAPIGLDGLKLEMGLVQGKTFDDSQPSEEDKMSAARQLLKLHKASYLHNDVHNGNLIKPASGGEVLLIDAGMSKAAGHPDGYHGLWEIDLVLGHSHPAVVGIKSAMGKAEDDFFDETAAARKLTDEAAKSKARGLAKLKYHQAYLAVADEFIK
jgi:hypothetical protein